LTAPTSTPCLTPPLPDALPIWLAASLGIAAGDMITLVSPQGDVTPMGVNPRVKSYPVSGLFEIVMSEYDSTIIYMPLEESQLYLDRKSTRLNSIHVKLSYAVFC